MMTKATTTDGQANGATWYWARRDTRWDVYPQPEPLVRVHVVKCGAFADVYLEDGSRARVGYILDRPCEVVAS